MPMPVTVRETEIEGVLEVETGLARDGRGFFNEAYSSNEWGKEDFTETFVQDCMSLSHKGVLRGMHYQIEPYGMGKYVRALTGAVFDVAVDLREGSPTFAKWVGRELREDKPMGLWIPAGFAHGFQALEENTLVYYKCTSHHSPDAERSLLYNDPEVAIEWPLVPRLVKKVDIDAPILGEAEYNFTYQG